MWLVKTQFQWQLLIITIVFSIVPTIAVVLRLVARRLKRRPLAIDDYLILCALVHLSFWLFDLVLEANGEIGSLPL